MSTTVVTTSSPNSHVVDPLNLGQDVNLNIGNLDPALFPVALTNGASDDLKEPDGLEGEDRGNGSADCSRPGKKRGSKKKRGQHDVRERSRSKGRKGRKGNRHRRGDGALADQRGQSGQDPAPNHYALSHVAMNDDVGAPVPGTQNNDSGGQKGSMNISIDRSIEDEERNRKERKRIKKEREARKRAIDERERREKKRKREKREEIRRKERELERMKEELEEGVERRGDEEDSSSSSSQSEEFISSSEEDSGKFNELYNTPIRQQNSGREDI